MHELTMAAPLSDLPPSVPFKAVISSQTFTDPQRSEDQVSCSVFQRKSAHIGLPSASGNQECQILYNLVLVMYNLTMAKVTMSEGRERLSEMVEVSKNEAVIFERYGRPAAVLVSADRYEEMMEALEEIEDISAFDAAMSEEGDNIPWEQVKQDLGWT